ncbi:MAG: peptidoglycan-binding protein [Thiotrichales bacterium]
MSTYRMGSHGEDVRKIQQALAAAGLYRGPIDGDFGGGTYAAVVAFQNQKGMVADGVVGAKTWKALTNKRLQPSQLARRPLIDRCIALTGAFETGKGFPECFCGIAGDFDGQGVSLGVLQWNFGQGTLQPLLREMMTSFPDVSREVLGDYFDPLLAALEAESDEMMEFARAVQHPVTHVVFEPWRGFTQSLGRTEEFQSVQVNHARTLYSKAFAMCADYGVWSERAAALMFDIVTQNGSIRATTRSIILADFRGLSRQLTAEELEVKKLEIIANRRAEAANRRWVDDVRMRKLCIARGGGAVHGIRYDVEEQYGIRLVPAVT